MIVTCPGCSSKYRVKNENVPAEGARMRCPKCETLFLAKPPTGPDAQQQVGDEPSSMFTQLNPATNTGPHSLRQLAQQQPPAPGAFGQPQPFNPQPFTPQPQFPPQAQPTTQTFGQPQRPPTAPFGVPQPLGPPPSFPPTQSFGQPQPFQPQPFAQPPPAPTQSFTQPPPAFQQPPPAFAQPGPFGQQAQPAPSTQSFTQPPPQPPFQAQPAPGVGKPQSGPITALFQAFDPGALPPEAQRPAPPPQPSSTPGAPDSGLQLDDGPKVRLNNPPASPPSTHSGERERPTGTRPMPTVGRPPRGPSLGAVLASYALLVAGAVVAASGLVFFLWTTEAANLDATLMPVFEHSFGRTPPHSTTAKPEELEELRAAATQATNAGDLPRSVVLWRRVKARAPDDPRAAPLIAKGLSDLGDLEGAP